MSTKEREKERGKKVARRIKENVAKKKKESNYSFIAVTGKCVFGSSCLGKFVYPLPWSGESQFNDFSLDDIRAIIKGDLPSTSIIV